ELLRQPHVLANMELQPFNSVMPQHEPQLERPKATAERYLPVTVVDDRARFSCLITQIFRQHAEGLDQSFSIGHVKAIAIEIGEHPLVRIEAVAVRGFDAIVKETKLGTERGGTGHGGIHV